MNEPDDLKGDPSVQPALGARVRAELDDVTPATAERLRVLRQTAVQELDRGRRPSRTSWWVAGGLTASAASIVLVTLLMLPGAPGNELVLPDLNAEELAVLQSMEVLEELEFLAWMEEEANRATAG